MRLLLDTHVLIWATSAPTRLSASARHAITRPENVVFVSAISLWEISIKGALGRLEFPLDRIGSILGEMGIEELPLTVLHGIAAGNLPRLHDDPFDRALVAQARLEGMTIVTEDPLVRRYEVPVL